LEYGSARNARLSLQEKLIPLQKKRRRCFKWWNTDVLIAIKRYP
jgi:hypothetical protein